MSSQLVKAGPEPLSGIVNLDKPAGMTSAAALNRIKRVLPKGTKVGHAGTLDPFATGVLLVLVGKATRMCEVLMDQPKQYEATIKLGATTETDDLDSQEVARVDVVPPGVEAVAAGLKLFVGEIMQRPPAYSAMKIGGRRAYKLAREGKTVKLAARKVRVDGIEMLSYEWPLVKVRIDCGRGTYIRAIARDLGEALGVGGYLTALRRTRVGAFAAAEGVSLERVCEEGVGKWVRG